jgi:hypothetical protein
MTSSEVLTHQSQAHLKQIKRRLKTLARESWHVGHVQNCSRSPTGQQGSVGARLRGRRRMAFQERSPTPDATGKRQTIRRGPRRSQVVSGDREGPKTLGQRCPAAAGRLPHQRTLAGSSEEALLVESVNCVEEIREDLRAIWRMLEDQKALSIRRHIVFRKFRRRGAQRCLE